MVTQSTSTRRRPELLRSVLKTNGYFSSLSGVLFILGASQIATLLGVSEAYFVIAFLGVGLLLFAAFVLRTAFQETLDSRAVLAIFIMDCDWVIASLLILVTDAFALSTEGRWAILIVADVVTVFAVLEFVGLRRLQSR